MLQFKELFRWLEAKISATNEEPIYAEVLPSTDDACNLLQSLSEAPWVQGRMVAFNSSSNTISLFDDISLGIHDRPHCNVPLRYRGIPVIPHNYAFGDPNEIPIARELSQGTASTERLKDGLTRGQLRELQQFIPGYIQSIDFYLDRHVVVTLLHSEIDHAVAELGYRCFRAWDCVFLLTITGIHEMRQESPSMLTMPNLGVNAPVPGLSINNDIGTVSRAGIFLRSQLRKTNMVSHFLVSAHSFIKKKRLKFDLNLWSVLIFVPIILLCLVATETNQSCKFPMCIAIQLAIIRIGLLILSLFNGPGTFLGSQSYQNSHQSGLKSPILYYDAVLLAPQVVLTLVRWTANTIFEEYPAPPRTFSCFLETVSLDCGFTLLLISLSRDQESLLSQLLFSISSSSQSRAGLAHVPALVVALSCFCIYNPVVLTLSYGRPFRFIALFMACIEVIHIVWGLDFVFLFNLLGQPVLRGHEMMGKIVDCDGVFTGRLFCPKNCADWSTHNIAVAELCSPQSSDRCIQLSWSEVEPNRNSRLFAIMTNGLLDEVNNGVRATEGILGGFRYVRGHGDYFSSTMFWRSESSSIEEDPGTMLVSLDTSSDFHSWHVVAFQVSCLPEDFAFHCTCCEKSVIWKLASKPPRQLIKAYDCLVPKESFQNILRIEESSSLCAM